MINAAAAMDAIAPPPGGCSITHPASGGLPAATTEPMEMCRVAATTITNNTSVAASGTGVKYKNAPTKLATALPPWNLRKTGYACPAITASAAALIHSGESPVSQAANHTAKNPLPMSSSNVTTSIARPVVRSTLVAPILPLPFDRTSEEHTSELQ